MLYVLTINDEINVGPVGWGTSLQEPLGLRGNALPPVPFESGEYVLRAYIETPPTLLDEYQKTVGRTSGINGDGVWEVVPGVADMSLASAQTVAKVMVAKLRWESENVFTIYNGVRYLTDRNTQRAIGLARVMAKEDASFSINWKAREGEFVELNATDIIALADAVNTVVQSAFNKEAEFVTSINDAANVDALRLIDLNAGWPT